jgi:phosphatidate cytidylyltransferase
MSELIKRVIVALIGIPIAIAIIYYGSWLMFALVAILTVLGQWEFYKIAEKKHTFPQKIFGYFFGIIFILTFQTMNFLQATLISVFIIILFFLIIMILELWNNKPNAGLNIATTLTGIVYIPISFVFIILIRNFYDIINTIRSSSIDYLQLSNSHILSNSYEGAGLLLSILISIWVCDSGAYFVGKAIGKHKLFERISPKKTWEGAIGGLIFGILGFWGSTTVLLNSFPLIHVIVIGIIVGTIGQIGDLAESQLKRDAGVKDSSAIIPGHGGVLDRFDSILFVMPFVFIYLFLSVVNIKF